MTQFDHAPTSAFDGLFPEAAALPVPGEDLLEDGRIRVVPQPHPDLEHLVGNAPARVPATEPKPAELTALPVKPPVAETAPTTEELRALVPGVLNAMRSLGHDHTYRRH